MNITLIKKQLYNIVFRKINKELSKDDAKILIKEQVDRQLAEHVADPTRGLLVDLFI